MRRGVRGGRAGAILAFAIPLLVAICLTLPSTAPGVPDSRAKKCVKAVVGNEVECLKRGDRCRPRFQEDYLLAGLSCRRGKLRTPKLSEQRGEEPYVLEPDGQLSLRTALDVVDSGVVDLPGLKPRKGAVGELFDASTALAVLGAHRTGLTPEQQQALDAATDPDLVAAAPRQAPSPERAEFQRYVDDAVESFNNRGFTFAKPIRLILLNDQGGTGPGVYAFVTGDDMPGAPVDISPTCNLFVTPRGRAAPSDFKRAAIAHEVTHCAQHAFYPSYAELAAAPDWLIEGSAMWLGWKFAAEHGVEPPAGFAWNPWLRAPNVDLFVRSYDAVGFFSLLDQGGQNVYERIKDALRADAPGSSQEAYDAAIANTQQDGLDRWGPGFARDRTLGTIWDLNGPGIVPSQVPVALSPGRGADAVATMARSGIAAELRLRTDILVLKVAPGTKGYMRDGLGQRRRLSSGAYTTLRNGFTCRTGRRVNLPLIEPGRTFIGFGQGVQAMTWVLAEGMTQREYCAGRQPRPPRPGSTCPTGGGTTTRLDGCSREVPGIEIYDESDQVVATFRSGNCTAGDDFVATSEDGAWSMEVGIDAFAGFDQFYGVYFAAPDPQVVIDGPGGPYGNQATAPSTEGPAPSGQIYLHPDGELGVGVVALNQPAESGVIAAGVMDCVYPGDL
jgi:hypothetical protein